MVSEPLQAASFGNPGEMLRTGMPLESLGNWERYSISIQLSSQDDPITIPTIPYNPIHKWYLGESRKILMGLPAFWHR